MLEERRRRHVGTHLLEQHRDLDPAQAEPALRLGYRNRRPALLDHRRPQLGVVPAAGIDAPTGPAATTRDRRAARPPRLAGPAGRRRARSPSRQTVPDVHVSLCVPPPTMSAAMDLHPTPAQQAPSGRVPGVAPGQPAVGVRQGPAAALRRPGRGGRVPPPVAAAAGRRRLGRRHLADRVRRPRRRPARPLHRAGGAGPGPGARAGRPHRHQPGGPDAARPRDRASRSSAGCPTSFAPSDCGASCSASPTPAATSRRSRRGPTGSTAAGALNGQKVWTSYAQFADWGLLPGPHRPRRAEAQGHHAPGRRHAPTRASTSDRCARSPARPTSTRSSSTTSSCPTRT